MQTILGPERSAAYARDGFVSGIRVFGDEEVARIRVRIEALEASNAGGAGGHSLAQFFRVNGQVVIPLLAELARTPAMLDAVEALLGPDLLVWSVELFIKEPGSDKVVSWHQDLTYWGMGETDDEVTAWVALSEVSVEAGCMRFIPGSHRNNIVAHRDSFDDTNLLSRGQQIDGIDEAAARHAPLHAGEMSLHHGRCFHASGANGSADRRIGLAVRYVTPGVRTPGMAPDYAMLVRGADLERSWTAIAGARALFASADLALYDRMLKDQAAALTAGATGDVGLYRPTATQEPPA